MQLGGTNDWLYDQFNLAGTLNFGGALAVSLLDGFTPSTGDRFDLFDFSSSSGFFSATNLPTLPAGLVWDTKLLYSSGEIVVDEATGSLQVTITPQAAIDAGAKWQVDSGAWNNSGDTVTDLLAGSHTVSYTNLTGWIKPTDQVVQILPKVTTVTNGTYEVPPVLLVAASQKTHGSAGTFGLNLNLNPAANPTVEPRLRGPNQILFSFNKGMRATDGTLDATEFTLTNATFVSASIVSSNLTLNLTNCVDQSKVTVVVNGISDLAGNPLVGTNAVRIRSLYGDCNLSGTVNAPDLQQVKNRLLQTANSTNYLSDLNCSGTVNAPDLQTVKNNLLHSAPTGGLTPPSDGTVGGVTQTFLSADSSSGTDKSVCPTTLAEALGAPELEWRTNGDDVWAPTLAPDGSAAAWSGSIGDLNVSWIETTVEGPGTITFQWKVSSELGGDFLTFSIDGVDQPGRISGEVDWQSPTFNIPSGTHLLRWTYAKNRDQAFGLDAGWLRRVSYRRLP
jgi:hypothetical protein